MANEWLKWHRAYDEDPFMGGRLHEVQGRIREVLDQRPAGPIRVISACAGDGRDLIGALVDHPRAHDVTALLVELSPDLVEVGRARASSAGFTGVKFKVADASTSNAYAGAIPADLVLFCGIFGNVSDHDVRKSIEHLPELCAAHATVIWTRGRFEPDLTPTIRRWFEESGFSERSFVTIAGSTKSVGVHFLTAPPKPFRPDVRFFTFLPPDQRPSNLAETRRKESTAENDGPDD
jgi:Putative methyltransferase